jgi:predicted negative regulator of RcsB-dependent stress response|tara:strand:+ start:289 stop:390 length:102 start_codon:yes stop_codon:yes gene_type:complete
MNNLKKYWKLAKDNKKVTIGVIIVVAVILTWVF